MLFHSRAKKFTVCFHDMLQVSDMVQVFTRQNILRKEVINMTRHMFAGAVTPEGFVDYFDEIMPTAKAEMRIYLKGSSGSGKSTFIKKIAAAFEADGNRTERFHCSNDPESLDALTIPAKKICILDATAPHSRDPKIPGAIDKIIDFANFIDTQKIRRFTDEIMTLQRKKALKNEKTAAYMAAVGNIYLAELIAEHNTQKNHSAQEQIPQTISKWAERLGLHEFSGSLGTDRKLFLSAVTPDGVVSYADSYFHGCKVHDISEDVGTQAGVILNELKIRANTAGFKTESFHCPFAPKRLDYLHLPQKKIALCAIATIKSELFESAIAATIESMRTSRSAHTKLEEIFACTIDFEKVRKLTDETVNMIKNCFL